MSGNTVEGILMPKQSATVAIFNIHFVDLISTLWILNFFYIICQHYKQTAGPICMKFSGKVMSDHGTTWFNFWSIPRSRNAQHGDGVCCALHHSLFLLNLPFYQVRWRPQSQHFRIAVATFQHRGYRSYHPLNWRNLHIYVQCTPPTRRNCRQNGRVGGVNTPVGSRDPVYNFLCWQLTNDDIMTSLLKKL